MKGRWGFNLERVGFFHPRFPSPREKQRDNERKSLAFKGNKSWP